MSPILNSLKRLTAKHPSTIDILTHVDSEGFISDQFYSVVDELDSSIQVKRVAYRCVYGDDVMLEAQSSYTGHEAALFHNLICVIKHRHPMVFNLKGWDKWNTPREVIPKPCYKRFLNCDRSGYLLKSIYQIIYTSKQEPWWDKVPEKTKAICENYHSQLVLNDDDIVSLLNGDSWISKNHYQNFFHTDTELGFLNSAKLIALLRNANLDKGKLQNRIPQSLLTALNIPRSVPSLAVIFDITSLCLLGIISPNQDEPLDRFFVNAIDHKDVLSTYFRGFFATRKYCISKVNKTRPRQSIIESSFYFNTEHCFSGEYKDIDTLRFKQYYDLIDQKRMINICIKKAAEDHLLPGNLIAYLRNTNQMSGATVRNLFNVCQLAMVAYESDVKHTKVIPVLGLKLLQDFLGHHPANGTRQAPKNRGTNKSRSSKENLGYNVKALNELTRGSIPVMVTTPWEIKESSVLIAIPKCIAKGFIINVPHITFGPDVVEEGTDIFSKEFAQKHLDRKYILAT